MRIAFITVGNPSRLTGGYLYHARVFQDLRERGLEIDQIVAAAADRAAQEAEAAAFGARFQPEAYDLVVVDALARVVCAPHLDHWRTVRPTVAMVHELPSIADGDPRDIADEAPLLRCDVLIAVSDDGAAILKQRGVAPDQIVIASPGLDRLPSEGELRPVRHADWPRVLCVAQWIPRKGIETLANAWLQRTTRNAVLELIGETDADPSYAARVRRILARTEPQSVVVHGKVSDHTLHTAYQRADLFALPSRYEGYGMVYAEALRFGLPIIACAVGPVPDLVESAALLVPADDPTSLALALDTLLDDLALRRRMASLAQERAAELPTWSDTADMFESALRQAILRRGLLLGTEV